MVITLFSLNNYSKTQSQKFCVKKGAGTPFRRVLSEKKSPA
jgi:hypothetical protein